MLGVVLGRRDEAPPGPAVAAAVDEEVAVSPEASAPEAPENASAGSGDPDVRRAGSAGDPPLASDVGAGGTSLDRATDDSGGVVDLEGATVALVIDDLGRSVATVDRLVALGVPLSFAVLPFESKTAQVVSALRSRGLEYLLHLPMEGASGANPGPGALRVGMTEGEIDLATRNAIEAVPGAVGVNNHMGSIVSSNRRSMEVVIERLSDQGLFFLDSRTSPESVGHTVALELGVPTARRHVFLDGERSEMAIERQLRVGVELAAREGSAIMIGHPYEETLAVLERQVPSLVAAGVRFVPVSYLLERRGADLEG